MLTMHRSPVYLLNRAIVVAEIAGPRAGIDELERDEQEHRLFGTTTCSTQLWASSTAGPAISTGPDSISKPPGSKPDQSMTRRSSIGGWNGVALDPNAFQVSPTLFSRHFQTRFVPSSNPPAPSRNLRAAVPVMFFAPSLASIPRRNDFSVDSYDPNPIHTPRFQLPCPLPQACLPRVTIVPDSQKPNAEGPRLELKWEK